jgi:endonuclease/exonuclease/phosphatase family metal-dependent hydrolase
LKEGSGVVCATWAESVPLCGIDSAHVVLLDEFASPGDVKSSSAAVEAARVATHRVATHRVATHRAATHRGATHRTRVRPRGPLGSRAMPRIPLSAAPLIAGAALLIAAPGALAAKKTTDVSVMTRNVFLGADLPPLAVAQQGADFEQKAGAMLAEVTAGDPNGRMKLIGREIARAKPDLVGLQEVSLWRTGVKNDPAVATDVRFDFLGAIRKELAARHVHYRVVAKRYGFNVEGPTDQGVDVRLSLGDAVLARKGVKVKHSRSGLFTNQLHFNTNALGDVNVNRSWNALDATVRGARIHLVNAHLEAYSPDIRLAQAKELVKGPLKSKRPTILVGDLNSGPDLDKPADRPPYQAIAKAGFKPRRTAKSSCCFTALDGDAGWDHNVDWIMSKPGLKLLRSSITGREKTPTGFHPADHGGVVSVLRVKR